jgi:hypothetical protein
VRARAGPWQISASYPIQLRRPEIHHAPANHKANRSTLRFWFGGAVRINQITCIRSKVLCPAKALPPDSLESPIPCSPQPQHGNSTSTLYSICQARIRLSLLDSYALWSPPGIDLNIWMEECHTCLRQDFDPCIVITELSMAISCVNMCKNHRKGGLSHLTGNRCSRSDP